MEIKLLSVVVGAILGGLISSFSYHYKLRAEVKGKINEALFHLLEIWSLIGMMKFIQSDVFLDSFINRLKKKFPKENINQEAEAKIKIGIAKGIPILIGAQAENDNSYTHKYSSAVNNLASTYPITAFYFCQNQILIKYLESVDGLLQDEVVTSSDELLMQNLKNFVNNDAFEEFEKDLVSLAKKSGYSTKKEVIKYIRRTKGRIVNLPDDLLDEYIDQVFAPAIQAHYDDMGVPNPNPA